MMTESLSSIVSSLTRREVHQRALPQRAGGQGLVMIAACCECATSGLAVALFVIGCVAATGHLSGIVAGGCIVGLSVPLVLIYLLRGATAPSVVERSHAVIYAVLMLALAIIGTLGITGILSAATAGWAVVGVALFVLTVGYCRSYCMGVALCAVLGASQTAMQH